MKYLFSKYQKPLLKFANHPFGRKFLGINEKEKLCRILPNGYNWLNKDSLKGKLYLNNAIANKLGLALTALDIAELRDVKSFLYYLGLNKRPFYTPMVHFANINVSAHTNTFNSVYKGDSATWSTTHDAVAGVGVYPDVGIRAYTGISSSNYVIERSFFSVDTSTIVGTISVASLYFYFSAKTATSTSSIYEGTQSTDTGNLAVADFDNCGTTSYLTPVLTNTDQVTNAFTQLALNATGIAAINQSGYTKFSFRNAQYDVADSAPPGIPTVVDHYLYIHGPEVVGKVPYLDYTAAVGGGANGSFLINFL
jgi:hypothetical protein